MIESFTLSGELRHQASGDVHYHVSFAGFEVIWDDPFYEMSLTWSEFEDVNSTGNLNTVQFSNATNQSIGQNLSRRMVTSVRKRKGLQVDEKVIKEDADKQRTMTKMK